MPQDDGHKVWRYSMDLVRNSFMQIVFILDLHVVNIKVTAYSNIFGFKSRDRRISLFLFLPIHYEKFSSSQRRTRVPYERVCHKTLLVGRETLLSKSNINQHFQVIFTVQTTTDHGDQLFILWIVVEPVV